MKTRHLITAGLLALAGFSAQAQVAAPPPEAVPAPFPGERILVAPPVIPSGSPLHGGAVTPSDYALLAQTLDSLANARGMEGSTVTIVAKNGELIMNGSAKDYAQAQRIEGLARNVAGGRVTAMIDPQGA